MTTEKKGNGAIVRMVLGGCVAIVGLVTSVVFFDALKTGVLGCLGPLLIVVGLIIVAVAKE
jgi:hypothetical protein